MNWSNLHEVTVQNEKPAPGWLFRDICRDAQQFPQDIPDCAEYLMRCVASESQTVCLKACLAVRHLADEVPQFREYMQRCPEALNILKDVSTPPQLAITASIERPEAKVQREAAARALRSCLSQVSVEAEKKAQVQERIQGFGNYAPPEEEQPRTGVQGAVDSMAGFVGDAVGDTVDDFREKGAIGAVRDGVLDAADLLIDGVGAMWSFLGGRKNAPAPVAEDRICKPREGISVGVGASGFYPGASSAQGAPMPCMGATPVAGGAGFAAASAPPAAYSGAFGRGNVGAGYSFSPAMLQQAGLAVPQSYPAPQPGGGSFPHADPHLLCGSGTAQASPTDAQTVLGLTAPAVPCEPEDLLSFEDEIEPTSTPADLLDFANASAIPTGPTSAVELKNRGNALVKEKKLNEAIKDYEAALGLMENTDATASNGALRATLFANIALCYLQQQLYRRAVEAATHSIEADATHAKAYYRRCLAHRALKMYDEAQRDLEALNFCKHDMTPVEMQRLHASLHASK